jgi:hypothetical protein
MAIISVNPPVSTKTIGGLDAIIFEIDTDDLRDGLSGIICTPGMGDIVRQWNDVGIYGNATPECNLDTRDPAVSSLIAKLLASR